MNEDVGFTRGSADLEDRVSLRRIESIRTDLADVTQVEYRQLRLERVVLVGVADSTMAHDEAMRSFHELKLLAETAGSNVLEAVMQRRSSPDPITFVGSGKVLELARLVEDVEADTVICDAELSAAQLRNLEDRLGVKVVDRTAVILDIFAQHAKSHEGKAQVELAQLRYLRQRLRGWGGNLSRQVGGRAASGAGIGGRGPGETKIETDRRKIASRISKLSASLKRMSQARVVKRAQRVRGVVPSVAIIGYTNAGKSSLLNSLTGADVLVDDSLFATLDPTTRRAETPTGRDYTLTDTVGFIRRLPTELIEAFASTLEESLDADLLLHVVDGSDPDPVGQIRAVREVLASIEATSIPEQIVINKTDLVSEEARSMLTSQLPDAVFISTRTREGMPDLVERIAERLPGLNHLMTVLVPFDRSELIDRMRRQGHVESLEHTPQGTQVRVRVEAALAGVLAAYVSDQPAA